MRRVEGSGVLGRRWTSVAAGLGVTLVGLVPGLEILGGAGPGELGGDVLGLFIDPQLCLELIQGMALLVFRPIVKGVGPAMGRVGHGASTSSEDTGVPHPSSAGRRGRGTHMRALSGLGGWVHHRRWARAVCPALAVVALGASATPIAGQAALDRQAHLDVNDADVEQALRLLGRASGVALLYSPDLLPTDRNVTCPCRDVTVRQALERILSGTGLTFTGSERQVRIVPGGSTSPAALTGVITGRVTGSRGESVPAARIRLDDDRHVYADDDGRFILEGVRPGTHGLSVTSMGWRTRLLEALEVVAADTLRLTVVLEPQAISLADIRVAPGRFSALEDVPPEAIQVLTREEILTLPQVGEDVFRSLKRLPGVAAHDISTRLHVRGGSDREVLVRLDGLDLYEPYHMKDWDGALGILDLNALGAVELSAGGFGAEYGDRMTAVLDMKSRTSVGDPVTTLGLSITNVAGMSRGGFAADRGSWLFSVRRGFMGLVIRLIGEDERLSPQYWDVFGKVRYQPAPGHVVSAHVLHAGDAFGLHELDAVEAVDVETEWKSSYGWVTWESALHDRVSSELAVWAGRLTRHRDGIVEDLGRPGMPVRISVLDDRTFSFGGVREQLSLDLGERAMLKLGLEANRLRAGYTYFERTWNEVLDQDRNPTLQVDSAGADLAPRGTKTAAWATVRARPWDRLTVDVGARYDRVTHSGDEDLSPRVLAALDLDAATTIRGSWGTYHQTHGIHELAVGDGEVEFYPAEETRQIALALERHFTSGITARVEAYSRTIPDQRPGNLNLEQELEIFPEAEGDRVRIDPARGRARGLELSVERDDGGRWSWSAIYVLASAEDEVPELFGADCADGQACADRLWVPRRYDQRHALALSTSYHPGPGWTLSAGWRYHSGWPATAWAYRVEQLESGRAFWVREFGPVRAMRLPAYHRLDLRATRQLRVRDNPLTLFVDLFNVYDRTNLASYGFGGTFIDGDVRMERRDGQTLLPFLPTFGVRYEF